MLRGPAATKESFPLLPDGAWPPGARRVARVLALKDLVLTFPLRLCAGHSNSRDSRFTKLSPLFCFLPVGGSAGSPGLHMVRAGYKKLVTWLFLVFGTREEPPQSQARIPLPSGGWEPLLVPFHRELDHSER